MKILKHGKTSSDINGIFKCCKCECEYLANIKYECKSKYHECYNFETYQCKCPECGQLNVTILTDR